MPAANAPTLSDEAGAPTRRAKPRRRWPLLLALVVLVSGGAGGGWWWYQSRAKAAAAAAADAKAKPERGPAKYHALEPSFVVNLADQDAVRYLQADVQLVTRDDETLAAYEAHAPALRNRLLLLFGQQSSAQLAQRTGKERLQEAAREEVRAVLAAEGARAEVDAVIFTSLVTQ